MSRRMTSLPKRSSYLLEPESSVILELADDALLAGLSGESAPRCRIPLPRLDTTQLGLCEDVLECTLRQAVNRFLYVELKGKRVMLVEQHFLCIRLKQVIARVLFTYHQARELNFLTGSVCASLAFAMETAIVVSLDQKELTVVPVFDYRPLNKYVRTTILAGDRIARRTRYLLQTYAGLTGLTDADVADFLARAAVCLPRSPLTQILPDVIADAQLEELYKPHAPDTLLQWQMSSSSAICHVPQWIRIACNEILFEGRSKYADFDEIAMPSLIQQAFRACPIDVRGQLKTIILTGSASQIQGLDLRLAKETGMQVADNIYGADLQWAGASLATSLRYEGQALLMTAFNADRRVPDWSK